MSKLLYKLDKIHKVYNGPAEELIILDQLDLEINAGERIAIIGASGSGKSTLLHILGSLDLPTSGQINFKGTQLALLNGEERAKFRNTKIGFVFQFHHLLPEFNTIENVAMQAIIGRMPKTQALELASEALDLVGLAQRKSHAVTTLSGGERQRAAIARAILNKPEVILADEPTGNLDTTTGAHITELLHRLNNELQTTLVVVTHNYDLAKSLGRCLELKAGILHEREI